MPRFLIGSTWLALTLAMVPPPPAMAQSGDRAGDVIGAVVQFSAGYGVWRIEQKCRKLSAARHDEYGRIVADGMRRLRETVDEGLFNTALSSGEATANDPEIAKCDDAGLMEFGMQQVIEASAILASLPAGYTLTITK